MPSPKPDGPVLSGARAAQAVESAQHQAGQAAHETARQARPWVERLARLGYGAKGVVYLVVGGLAILAASGLGGKKTGAEGALTTIAAQPLGKLMLAVLALGLAGYALWRLVQGLLDPEHKGADAKGMVKRAGYVLSGLAYVGLALSAVQIVRGAAADKSGSTQDWTARLMAQPLGQWLVAAVGAAFIAVGANTLYVAYKEKFRDKLKLAQMSATEQAWATRLGKIGLTARAVVSGLVGAFLIRAALSADPNQARGLDGALKVLAQQAHGRWLLGVVAVGLVAYGVYSFVEARYRRVLEP